jgi:hypothetical protein
VEQTAVETFLFSGLSKRRQRDEKHERRSAAVALQLSVSFSKWKANSASCGYASLQKSDREAAKFVVGGANETSLRELLSTIVVFFLIPGRTKFFSCTVVLSSKKKVTPVTARRRNCVIRVGENTVGWVRWEALKVHTHDAKTERKLVPSFP